MDNYFTGSKNNVSHLDIELIRHDVTAPYELEVDQIYNLACPASPVAYQYNPIKTINTSVIGAINALELAYSKNADVLQASTSEVYGKRQNVPFREDEDVILGPSSRARWAYAASKLMDEFLGLAYWREYSLPVVIFRLFNTVGPRQVGSYGMVIPRFVQQALQAKPLTIFGDGKQARCFLHVQDAVEGIIRLSETPSAVGEVFNIGSTQEYTIHDLARHTLAAVNAEAELPPANDARLRFIPYEEAYAESFDDMRRRVPDITKMHTATAWQPRYTFADILQDVIADLRRTSP
jgi:UDP-glucose 4-epimerase